MNKINSVLIVCIGNICRSPYGEIKLKTLYKNGKIGICDISSAGIFAETGEKADIFSIKIASERGLDLTNHTAKQLCNEQLNFYDLILVMELLQKNLIEKKYKFISEKVQCIGKWRNLEIEDPYGKPYSSFINMANNIDNCLGDWILKIK